MSTPSEPAVTSGKAVRTARPGLLVAGCVLGAVAGVEVLFVGIGIAGLFTGWQTTSVEGQSTTSGMFIGGSEPIFWAGVAGIVVGLMMLVVAILPLVLPRKAGGLGITSIVLAVVALVAVLGGLLIGSVLGIAGGVLTLAASRR